MQVAGWRVILTAVSPPPGVEPVAEKQVEETRPPGGQSAALVPSCGAVPQPDPLSPHLGPGSWGPGPHPPLFPEQPRPRHPGKESQNRPGREGPFTRLLRSVRSRMALGTRLQLCPARGGGKGQNEVGELRFSRGCGPSCSPSLKAPRDSCLRPWGERGESQAGTGQRLVLEASLEVSQSGFWRSQPLTFWKPGGRPLGQEY